MRPITRAAIATAIFAVTPPALAADALGTSAEARAMLEKVVAEIKSDKTAALAKINHGGFRDRDLYPFCMRASDGMTTAHPTNVGTNILELKDKRGKAFGKEMFSVAEQGKLKTVSYMWPKPGQSEPSPKESFVTRVDDQICGVGFYK